MCVSEFPKIKVFVVQLVSNHLSQKWCYQHRYHHILLCFFGSAKGCRNVAPWKVLVEVEILVGAGVKYS